MFLPLPFPRQKSLGSLHSVAIFNLYDYVVIILGVALYLKPSYLVLFMRFFGDNLNDNFLSSVCRLNVSMTEMQNQVLSIIKYRYHFN